MEGQRVVAFGVLHLFGGAEVGAGEGHAEGHFAAAGEELGVGFGGFEAGGEVQGGRFWVGGGLVCGGVMVQLGGGGVV